MNENTNTPAENTRPTHAIVDATGNAVATGSGEELLPKLAPMGTHPYRSGFRVVPIEQVRTAHDGATVSAVSQERQARTGTGLVALATSLGLDARGFAQARSVESIRGQVSEAGIPLGTAMLDIGHTNIAKSHDDWSRLPDARRALFAMADRIDSEKRFDRVTEISKLWMVDDGRLVQEKEPGSDTKEYTVYVGREPRTIHGGARLRLEENALPQLLTFVNDALPRAGSLLSIQDPEDRASTFNKQKSKLTDGRKVKARMRNGTAPLSAYAFVSETYPSGWEGNVVCRTVAQALPSGDLRGEIDYDPNTTMLNASFGFHADPSKVIDFGAGDTYEIGFYVITGDARNSGIRGGLFVKRNECINFIILSYSTLPVFDIRHVGQGFGAKVRDGIAKLMRAVPEALNVFASDWGKVQKIDAGIITTEVHNSPLHASEVLKLMKSDKLIDRLVAQKLVDPKQGRELAPVLAALPRKDELLERGFAREPGRNLDSVLNAMTRVHELGVDIDTRLAYEGAAGQLLPVFARAARQVQA